LLTAEISITSNNSLLTTSAMT